MSTPASGPTFGETAAKAKGHASAFFKTTIGEHPVASAVAMGVLVLVIVVLAFYVSKYKTASAACSTASTKSGFGVRSVNNLSTGGNNPLWWHGAGDAGWGGSVHRETTATQAAAYMPQFRRGDAVEHAHMHQPHHFREGLATAPESLCQAGQTAVTYQNPDGTVLTRCVAAGGSADMSACKASWDPAATAEAQALATVGSFQHDSYGDRALQGAINKAYDVDGLTDEQLAQMMHQGGAP